MCIHAFVMLHENRVFFFAVLYCLWPVRLFHIFPYYLINGTIFFKKKIERKMYVLISSTTFA